MRSGRHSVESMLSEGDQQVRRRNEINYAIQTIAIAICGTLTWIVLISFPLIIPPDQPQWFALVALGMILNSSIGAVIYLCFNRELYKAVLKNVFRQKTTASTTLTLSVSHQTELFQSRNVDSSPKPNRVKFISAA